MERISDITIIDYGLGNLFSIKHAFTHIGLNAMITSEIEEILKAKILILPGVGAFGDAMRNLQKLDLISPIKEKVNLGTPLIGICLGMQLLFEESEEFGINKGLCLIPGCVRRIPNPYKNKLMKVPIIGWNVIYNSDVDKWKQTPLCSLSQNSYMYFVHSYYVLPTNKNNILTYSNYEGFEYCSSVTTGNICGFQFHPEKSGVSGLEIYRNIKKAQLSR